jgi:hypothetical protein
VDDRLRVLQVRFQASVRAIHDAIAARDLEALDLAIRDQRSVLDELQATLPQTKPRATEPE